ncbi:MAG: glucosamine-6-phosphate deaminase, partial [Spirochaetaceae bacterium]
IAVFEELDLDDIEHRNNELINYFQTQYPGKRDLPYIQKLKGMCREWESACLWGYFGWSDESVEHLRLGFYQGEIFTEEPTVNRDAVPVLDLVRRVRPDVVTVAFDPEASGPDTHYKVMQAVAEGLRLYAEETKRDDLKIIGYRNIWYRFHPAEANVYVPVSLNMLTLQHSSFMHTYISQKDASFPSYEHDGPFPELAQRIQVDQYDTLSTCLGRDFFYEHPSALIRATRGFVFIREMELDEFATHSRELKRRAENL